MRIEADKRTREWLQKQGGMCTVEVFPFPGEYKNKRIFVDFHCIPQEPAREDHYAKYEVEGCIVYIHQDLKPKRDTIKLHLSGNTAFQHLEVKGLKRLMTEKTTI
ncbi:CC/Se motif family (seleno)protein [Alkalicoccus luteus]|uniref:Uncharacterized protein n=1 Tax=Alkalicoccus luteus TaxID=1237094 RepID=A0A969PS13_9BACI|nr:CC/Se motif family (seleno)protein [Alkalicoccus luteus]NJP36918.1 hypothetical protein [Alkalicoccus luteus]